MIELTLHIPALLGLDTQKILVKEKIEWVG